MTGEPLGSRNPKVAQARLLARDRKERQASGLAVLEGIRLTEEALVAGVAFEYVLAGPSLSERGADVVAQLAARRVPVYPVSAEALERAADTESPQGIVAVFQPRRWELDELRAGPVLVLDGLQDPGNLGTLIRSLNALGGGGAVVAGGVDPYNPKVIRGAMGSLFRLPVAAAPLSEAVAALRAAGRRIYLADAGDGAAPWAADLGGPVAVIIGNEGAGPSEEARRLADAVITIPMPGGAESLNAGVAASLLVYEALRQRAGG